MENWTERFAFWRSTISAPSHEIMLPARAVAKSFRSRVVSHLMSQKKGQLYSWIVDRESPPDYRTFVVRASLSFSLTALPHFLGRLQESSKFFIICSYEKCACNPFRICSYKTLDSNVKSFGISSYEKRGKYLLRPDRSLENISAFATRRAAIESGGRI